MELTVQQDRPKRYDLRDIWNEQRPLQSSAYSGYDLVRLPLYEHRRLSPDCLRLLHVQAGKGEEPIVCSLAEVKLADDVPYEAVSYCWGDYKKTCNVMCEGHRMPVTESAVDALWHFRHPGHERVLWIDAICIDQDDYAEKARQVRAMGHIYSAATQVLIWAGNDAYYVAETFKVIRDVYSVIHADLVSRFPKNTEPDRDTSDLGFTEWSDVSGDCAKSYKWFGHYGYFSPHPDFKRQPIFTQILERLHWKILLSILKISARPYFERCWVVQEISLAKSAIVQVGRNRMDWPKFVPIVRLISNTSPSANWAHVVVPGAGMRVAHWLRYYCRALDGHERRSVLAIAATACALDATLPVDRLFAFNAFKGEGEEDAFRIDYTTDPHIILCKASEAIFTLAPRTSAMTMSYLLSLLTFSEKHKSGQLPSWVPDLVALSPAESWTSRLAGMFSAGKAWNRLGSARPRSGNPKILVIQGVNCGSLSHFAEGDPVLEKHLRPAAVWMFSPEQPAIYEGLAVEPLLKIFGRSSKPGIYDNADTLADFAPIMREICASTLATLKPWLAIARDGEEENAWRAISCGCGVFNTPDSQDAFRVPPWSKLAHAKPDLTDSANWTNEHPTLRSMTDEDLKDLVASGKMHSLWRNARFCRTTDGRLGWVPVESRSGDTICIFAGASTPHIIREAYDGCWKIIGPAYIQGIMDGEAMPDTLTDDDFFHIS